MPLPKKPPEPTAISDCKTFVAGVGRVGLGIDEDEDGVHLVLLEQHVFSQDAVEDRVEGQHHRDGAHQHGDRAEHPFLLGTAHHDDAGAGKEHDKSAAQVARDDGGPKGIASIPQSLTYSRTLSIRPLYCAPSDAMKKIVMSLASSTG